MNETDLDRLESKTANASVVDLAAYRAQAELKTAASRTDDIFAGAAQFGVSPVLLILAIIFLAWFFLGRR